MRSVKLLFSLLITCSVAFSSPVRPDRARTAALHFFSERNALFRQGDHSIPAVRSLEPITDHAGRILYFIVKMSPDGFVLVSGNDEVMPVLGYGYDGDFSDQHCNVGMWMNHYSDQISYCYDHPGLQQENVKNAWTELESTQIQGSRKSITEVSPLLVSKWNQDTYYNEQCPEDPAGPDGHCYAGCVATAMGQLEYYYRFPYQGTGSYSYVHPDYGTISADFGSTTYDWNGMPSTINNSSPSIATLLFHQGVSVDMDYGPDGSGMWNHKAAYSLKTYFKYGPETRYYFRDSISLDWDSILVANLNQRKPLYYAGWAGVQSTNGHAFVCDGYQGTDYFHFNWGWGGQSDGYFYTGNLNPSGANFNFAQEVIPLFPDTIQYGYPQYCSGYTVLHQLRGSVEDGSGWYPYAANSDCSWLIDPQDPQYDSITRIRLTFTRLDTEAGVDQVSVYDGDSSTSPLIGTYSGNNLPPVINSSGSKLFIVFHSDGANQSGGWQADYEPVFPVYCTGTTIINDFSGNIGDGSGPKNYNNNSICRWKILPVDAASVTLTFTNFSLPDSSDMLRIYDLGSMTLLGTLTGTSLPDPVISGSGKMMLLFNTNKTVTGGGWDGYFTGSLVGTDNTDDMNRNLVVSPVPSDGWVQLDLFSRVEAKTQVSVLDLQGKEVYNYETFVRIGDNRLNLDLSFLPASIYLIQVKSNKFNKQQKVLIY